LESLSLYIESLIFASDSAITIKTLKQTLNSHFDTTIKDAEIIEAIDELKTKYNDPQHSFEILEIADGYQFMTKGAYYPLLSQHLRLESKRKLSKSALETLAIISYKQPTPKSSIEGIRGVNCDYSIQKLLEKELIQITGRDEGPGRPLLYGTTEKFLNHFGLKNLKELPKLKEFELEEASIGLKEEE
jgi:segregation and condensation protein B